MNRITYRFLRVALAAVFICAFAQELSAKPKRGGGGGGGQGANQGGGANQDVPTTGPSNSQAAAALQAMKDAQDVVEETFESSSQWIAAQAAVKQAQTEYDESCGPVLDTLKASAPYQAAVDAQSKADDSLKDAQNTGSSDDISAAAQADMQAKSAVKAMEAKALASDPTTAAAKQKLTAAYAAMAALKQQEQNAVHTDPTWLAAKKQLDAARGGG